MSCKLHAPAALPSVKKRSVPIEQEVGLATAAIQMIWGKEESLACARDRIVVPRSFGTSNYTD
jgi:hypothetical protein